MAGLHLLHDVLDAQLLDRRKRKIGRVDELAIELRDGRPPRVAAFLIGGPMRVNRIGRWAVRLSHGLRAIGRVRRTGVSRIPFSAMRCLSATIEVDVDGKDLEAGHLEQWLAENVICRIPGAGAEKKQ
jgi:hypothetical protein